MSTARAVFRTFKDDLPRSLPRLRNLLFLARWLSSGISLAGMAIYASMLWTFAHTQFSVLDEGLYLYKGWLFTGGRYTPFQDYGVWTNQMPLAFLIPGWIQQIFGPGLRTGRMLAVLLGMLMLLGLWLTARRLGGRWIAAGCVASMALNPAAARMLAMAASQGLVACMLVWTLFFCLGADRKNWQLFIGGLLAGATVMVRINLLPLLPLLAVYIIWARGFKLALWWLGGNLLSFGGVHLAYWPNILKLWAKWLPLPFLKPWFSPENVPTWKPDNPLQFRVASFFLAFRYHFAALAGALASWIFWPKRERFDPEKRKIALFLSALLLIFFVLHAWAALGNEYCVFCFPTYSSFYSSLGLLLAAITLPVWNLSPATDFPGTLRLRLGGLAFLGLLAGMAYSAEAAAEQMLGALFYKRLLAAPVPGLHGALLWQVLANKFELEYKAIYDGFHTWLPVCLALAFGLLLFTGLWAKPGGSRARAWGLTILIITLLGSALAPAPVLAGDYTTYDCASDVIPGYEMAGALLAKSIPAGARIFWAGYSPVTLTYIPGVQIYPPQLNGVYSFRISPDQDALLKYGWWNESLAEKWLNEADFVLAEQKNVAKGDWLYGKLQAFELVTGTPPQMCQENTEMLLFRRK